MEAASALTFWTFIKTRIILSVLKLNYNEGIISLIIAQLIVIIS